MVELWDVEQVAHLLGMSTRHVRQLVADGKFPRPLRLSHKCSRWPASAVEEWLVSSGIPARPPRGRVEAPPEAQAPRVYTARQVAAALQIPPNAVYRTALRLGLKKRKIGGGFLATEGQMARLQALAVTPMSA